MSICRGMSSSWMQRCCWNGGILLFCTALIIFRESLLPPIITVFDKTPSISASEWQLLTNEIRDELDGAKTDVEATNALVRTVNANFDANIRPFLLQRFPGFAKMDLVGLRNQDETKYAFVANNSIDDCILVSLGIGKDIEAEKKLKKRAPFCSFYGADPSPKDGKLYEEVGKYFPLAISATGGSHKHRILSKGYRGIVMQSTSLDDFLINHVKHNNIDHLWLDVEGPEFELLPAILHNDGQSLPSYSICQLNIELHFPVVQYHQEKLTMSVPQMMLQLFTASSFLPVHAFQCDAFPGCPMVRIFLINAKAEYCRQKLTAN